MMMIVSGLVPTCRAVIDINRPCNAKCRMCYYIHDGAQWSKPVETVAAEINSAISRGNTTVDFTGGEPTLYPKMTEVIALAESQGLHTCIITNGLALDKIKEQVSAGCRQWLVSLHGYEETHDEILGVKGAWDRVNRTIEWLNSNDCFVRVNCTLTRLNTPDLDKLARHYIDTVKARIVNFINFNPHYQWGESEQPAVFKALNEIQVPVSQVAPYLQKALDILREHDVWTNVRYFPMCVLKGYESHVCNNPQVMFDPYEWDYGVTPKTTEAYLDFGRLLQKKINTAENRCQDCGILNVCGGLNKNYAAIRGFSEMVPYSQQSDYPYYFMKEVEADIIIPAYQPDEGVKRLLAEIIEKTVPPYNLVVISREQSAAKNRNYGLHRSQSPYIIMCDDDIDNLPYGWNRELINDLRENREFLGLSARLLDREGRIGCNTANNYDVSRHLVPVEMIPTACCVFRKTGVRFDERYIRAGWEDTDFFTQLRFDREGRYAIDNLVQVVHLNEEKNGGGAANEHNRRLFIEKWQKKTKSKSERRETFQKFTALKEQAKEALEKGQFRTALPLVEEALTMGLKDADLFHYLGYTYWHLGRQQEACDYFYQAANMRPDDKDMVANFFDSVYTLSRFDLLETYLREMVVRYPEINEYLYLLAECLFEEGKYIEALDFIKRLIVAEPDHSGLNTLFEKMKGKLNPGLSENVSGVSGKRKESKKGNASDGSCETAACPAAQAEGKASLGSRLPAAVAAASIAGPPKGSPEKPATGVDIKIFNHAPYMTRRGCVDDGHVCNINCLFCYHRFEVRRHRRFLGKETIMNRLNRDRGEFALEVTDFTGGEPTIHPDIIEIVQYGYDIGNRVCLITHGQWNNLDKIDRIIDAGVHSFLISLHGPEKEHDYFIKPGAFEKVMRSIRHLEKREVPWRVNCVANSHNMAAFGEYARLITGLTYPPDNANFIVFSPLAGWTGKDEIDFQARHSELAPFLQEAIDIFTQKDIWCNVRYYPLCMLPGQEQHITCFPQICYDPFEWDYRSYCNMEPEAIAEIYQIGKKAKVYAENEKQRFHNTWSLVQSQRVYRKSPQCTGCGYRLICDGVAGQYASRFGFEELTARSGPIILDPIHFRRDYPQAVGKSK